MTAAESQLDVKLARLLHTAEVPGILYGSCFDPVAGNYFGGGADGFVYVLNVRPAEPFAEKGKAEQKWRHHDNYIAALAWHDGLVVSGGYDRRIIWTRADCGEKLREVNAHDGWIRDVGLIPNQPLIASIGDDMLLKVWDSSTGELVHRCEKHALHTPEGFSNALYALAASIDGKFIATADRSGQVCVWDAATGRLQQQFRAEAFYTYDSEKRARSIGGIRALCFLPGGQLVLGGIGQVSNVDGFVGPCRVEIWNWQELKRIAIGTDKHQAIFNHFDYLPAEKLLIGGGGGDGGPLVAFWNENLWENKTEAPLSKAKPKSHIQHFAFDAKDQQLLAVGHNGMQVWSFTAATKAAEKK